MFPDRSSMPESLWITMFATLMGMVLTWFALVAWLYRRLRMYHPETYESIGSPTLFWNNSPRNGWLLTKYTFRPIPTSAEDRALSRVLVVMKIFLVTYCVLFAILLVSTVLFPLELDGGG